MEKAEITTRLKEEAAKLGFAQVGVCSAVEPPGVARFHQWLEAGYAGEMDYLAERKEAYQHPSHVLDGARSVVVLAMHYRTNDPAPLAPGYGRIARYAWGESDYHDVIHKRLKALATFLNNLVPNAKVRGVVDTAPLLEREFAQLAGLGWLGKNTLLLNKHDGSYFFLAVLLTDLELTYDTPHETDHCGTCRACLDACPTNAFPQPYVLDASKCISYLTIELRNPIPTELRAGMNDWLFGCDICQEVCPWNRKAPEATEAAFVAREETNPVDLVELFFMDDQKFRERFRHTPLWRSKRRGILRNAAIVLGNQCPPHAVRALVRGLNDDEILIRGSCAWALGRYRSEPASAALDNRLTQESDPGVRREIENALQFAKSGGMGGQEISPNSEK